MKKHLWVFFSLSLPLRLFDFISPPIVWYMCIKINAVFLFKAGVFPVYKVCKLYFSHIVCWYGVNGGRRRRRRNTMTNQIFHGFNDTGRITFARKNNALFGGILPRWGDAIMNNWMKRLKKEKKKQRGAKKGVKEGSFCYWMLINLLVLCIHTHSK